MVGRDTFPVVSGTGEYYRATNGSTRSPSARPIWLGGGRGRYRRRRLHRLRLRLRLLVGLGLVPGEGGQH